MITYGMIIGCLTRGWDRMAVGLGATVEETEDLKKSTDDTFWVMRIIGYPPIPSDHDGFSCGAHKCVWPCWLGALVLTIVVPVGRLDSRRSSGICTQNTGRCKI